LEVDVSMAGTSKEQALALGIAAMGRVSRDEDGFTVYGAGPAPDAFRVWDDPHAGSRCTCARFAEAFARGEEYRCEHLLAVGFWLEPPAEEVSVEPEVTTESEPLRRVV
jgi:hypothetical protein